MHDCDSDSDSKGGITETEPNPTNQRVVMEINNNNSPYHPHKEDKDDKIDKRVQCENKTSQVVFSRERIVEKSLREIIEIKAMSAEITDDKHVSVALQCDSDESSRSHNDLVTRDNIPKVENKTTESFDNESAEKLINSGEMIKVDSERLDVKCVGEMTRAAITTSEVPLINERNRDVTQSMGESEYFVYK